MKLQILMLFTKSPGTYRYPAVQKIKQKYPVSNMC